MAIGGELKVIAGSSNRVLAEQIVAQIAKQSMDECDLVDAVVPSHPDGETKVEIGENIRGSDVFIVQSTSNPANHHVMELCTIVDAVRRSSARRITAVIPYFGYARQDRKEKGRTPITAKLVANLLTAAGVSRVLTCDLHADQIQGFFDIPVDHLTAEPVFALDIERIARRRGVDLRDGVVVVSPDVGGVRRARNLARVLGTRLAVVNKERNAAGEVERSDLIGDVAGAECILVDDICSTAGTLMKAADELLEGGATRVSAYATHGVYAARNEADLLKLRDRLGDSALASLATTDTIAIRPEIMSLDVVRRLPLAPLLARAIRNIADDKSVSKLFSKEEVASLYVGEFGES